MSFTFSCCFKILCSPRSNYLLHFLLKLVRLCFPEVQSSVHLDLAFMSRDTAASGVRCPAQTALWPAMFLAARTRSWTSVLFLWPLFSFLYWSVPEPWTESECFCFS